MLMGESVHKRGTAWVLGYAHAICVECETSWPCVEFVKARCARLNLAHGLPCECGWHEGDEKVAQDPEHEKVA